MPASGENQTKSTTYGLYWLKFGGLGVAHVPIPSGCQEEGQGKNKIYFFVLLDKKKDTQQSSALFLCATKHRNTVINQQVAESTSKNDSKKKDQRRVNGLTQRIPRFTSARGTPKDLRGKKRSLRAKALKNKEKRQKATNPDS